MLTQIYSEPCAKDGMGSPACANLQRARNLEAAYEGWLAVGCPLEVDGNGQRYQSMEVADTSGLGIRIYQCRVTKTGCRRHSDCHLGGAGSVCYCYGRGCIDTGVAVSGTGDFRNVVRGSKRGSFNEGVNKSCHYKAGPRCDCDWKWQGGLRERKLYEQSRN